MLRFSLFLCLVNIFTMNTNSFKYYVFYDLETTGINPAFDQILQFAAIKTDLNLNIIEEYEYNLKLRQDVIPQPGALIVNRLNINKVMNGEKEYEAVKKMHAVLSAPDTINLGYNTISFDDEFMRFAYDRNLLNPYSNQNNQADCARMDVMPITILYFLYQKNALRWPENNGRPNLKLENLNELNGLARGMAHDALVDVKATIELAKRLRESNTAMWNYLCEGFDKNIDLNRINSLDKIILLDGLECELGIFIRNRFGYKNNCMSLCAKVLYQEDMSRSFWLRLDTKDFKSINLQEILSELEKSTVNRKIGVPDFILPIKDKYNVSSEKKKELFESNLNWMKSNPQYIEALKDRLLNKTYESIDIDSDAALYSRGSLFFDKDKKKVCQDFHKIDDLELKNSFVESISFDDVREIAIRIMGRNYYSSLSTRVKDKFHEYMQSINEGNHFDFRGGKRNTIEKSLNDIRARLEDVSKLESDQVEILESFEKYLLEKD